MNEVWNAGNWAVARELVDPGMVVHGAGGQVIEQGPEGVIELVRAWRAAFPDGRMEVHDYLAEGDLVADRMTWVGTHTGAPFYGIPATGTRVTVTSIGSDRIIDGRIVEGWGELDMLGLMQQLGAVPTLLPDHAGSWGDRDSAVPRAADPVVPEGSVLAAATALLAALQAGDAALVGERVDATFVDHDPTTGAGSARSAVAARASLRGAMPDLTVTPLLDHTISEGDRVLVRWTARGRHDGTALFGAAPSGSTITWTGSDIFRVAGGRVAERWTSADTLGLARQAGAVG
ncbi:MAG: ester cyclase [Kineosporiaceae bacterium]